VTWLGGEFPATVVTPADVAHRQLLLLLLPLLRHDTSVPHRISPPRDSRHALARPDRRPPAIFLLRPALISFDVGRRRRRLSYHTPETKRHEECDEMSGLSRAASNSLQKLPGTPTVAQRLPWLAKNKSRVATA